MIYIGKIVNTHGIKGEIRIISDFKYKDIVFKKDNIIYINDNKYVINSYRHHKVYDMITINGITNIEEAQKLKNNLIYVKKEDYEFGILNEDLINLDVYDNEICKGKVIDVKKGAKYDILVIDGIKKHMVPLIDEFIKEIDIKNNKIFINYIKGLDNED